MLSEDKPELNPSRPATLAERLNQLFATITSVDDHGRRREYSTPHVASAISEDPSHDTTVSRVYLATLRSGTNVNPTVAVVRAIAKFFDEHRPPGMPPVTAGFLLGDDADEEETALRRALDDRNIRSMAMRAGVPLSYSTDESSGDGADVRTRLLRALADPSIQAVALRMADADLSDEGAAAVLAMIEQVQRLERAARQREPRKH